MRTSKTITIVLLLTVQFTASAAEPVQLPNHTSLESVDFDRHVAPLLSRYGCNAGACHGSFEGRGGMRLSLFGLSSSMDFDALAPRIDTDAPADSLLLLKPTEQTDHEGGQRFAKGSWPYEVICAWIAQGGMRDGESRPLVGISVEPSQITLSKSSTRTLKVTATSADGSTYDVTCFCGFVSRDEGIARVDTLGHVTPLGPGATHITIEYSGHFASIEVVVPDISTRSDTVTRLPIEHNKIDRLINHQLRRLNLSSTPDAGDATFLRRVTLDTIARLPTIDEMGEFAADQRPDRRDRVIDRLLSDERHASLWATRFCDMTRCSAELMEGPDSEKPRRAHMWHDWFRVRVHENVAYNQIVRGVLCGTSRGELDYETWIDDEAEIIREIRAGFTDGYVPRRSLDLFWRRVKSDGSYPRHEIAEIVSAAFLGIRLECAQCHKHPYDRWTQDDYRSFGNILADVQFGSSTQLNTALLARMEKRRSSPEVARGPALPKLAEVYRSVDLARPLADLETGALLPARPLGGVAFDPNDDAREQLMNWLTGEGRQQFASNLVNRVWSNYFGQGLVEPVDGFSANNPASHQELLDDLAARFIASGYDLRWLEREILRSASYQRSSARRHHASVTVPLFVAPQARPMIAETAVDVLHQSLGVPFAADGLLPAGVTAIDAAFDRPMTNGSVSSDAASSIQLLSTFGRGRRKSVCDCDRQRDPTLRQSLFRMSDSWVIRAMDDGTLLGDLSERIPSASSVEFAYAKTLGRGPNDSELTAALDYLESREDRREAWKDLIWALINTQEFHTIY